MAITEYKKVASNLIKVYIHWCIVAVAVWNLAEFYVDFYEGHWPHIGFIEFAFNVFERYPKASSVIGSLLGTATGLYHWYEVKRKR